MNVFHFSVLYLSLLLSFFWTHQGFSKSKDPGRAKEQKNTSLKLVSSSDLEAADLVQLVLNKKSFRLEDVLFLAFNRHPDLRSIATERQLAATEKRQKSLVQNPTIEISSGFPFSSPDNSPSLHLFLSQNISDWIQSGPRKKAAGSEFESRNAEIDFQILKTLSEVKKSYFRYQGLLEKLELLRGHLSLSESNATLAKRQKDAGNLNALDEASQQLALKDAELLFGSLKAEALQARVELASQIGVLPSADWKIAARLPALPNKDPDPKTLLQVALKKRSDLKAQKYAIDAKKHQVAAIERDRIPGLEFGMELNFESDGSRSIVPGVVFEIPIAGHRKANLEKAQLELKSTEQHSQSLEAKLPYQIDLALYEMKNARGAVAFYQNQVLPLRRTVIEEALKHYNFMLIANQELWHAKKNEIETRARIVDAKRDYWIAATEIEFLVGLTGKSLEAK